MSATDMTWLFSEAVLPAQQAYLECEPVLEAGSSVSFATVTLHMKSVRQKTQGFTAVICFKCYQAYVDVVPSQCDCGEMLVNHLDDDALSVVPSDAYQWAPALSADPGETRAVATNNVVWPPWAIPPSIISGDTVTTSPYVSQIRIAEPPPPPPAFLSRTRTETRNRDILLVIVLGIVMLGLLYLLRTLLAL